MDLLLKECSFNLVCTSIFPAQQRHSNTSPRRTIAQQHLWVWMKGAVYKDKLLFSGIFSSTVLPPLPPLPVSFLDEGHCVFPGVFK